jgi:TonB-linked SusC/RagA family outer membrane protein
MKHYQILLLIMLLGLGFHHPAAGQSGNTNNLLTIKGKVHGPADEPLIGVYITVVNTPASGTISGSDGSYILSNVSSNASLRFSYLGMETKVVAVNNRSNIDVSLETSAEMLDPVVVTAFATQKRINVTGAISTLSGSNLIATPVANISNALIGALPGVGGIQVSGEPGNNAATIRIRGVGTYGNATPLIVIDGVERPTEQAFAEFNAIDPNEIIGISVLKDASSTAVYGIRGANGVIIVTTKRGLEGKPVISFSANYGITKATNLQKGLSSYDWAYMRNEAIRHEMDSYSGMAGNSTYIFSQSDLWKMRNHRDYTPQEVAAMNISDAQKAALLNSSALYYGSSDMYVEQFGNYGPQFQANLSVSGGTERVKYFTSFGYFSQTGTTPNEKYYAARTGSTFDRYNYRSNFDLDLHKNLRLTVNLSGQFGKANAPGYPDNPFNVYTRYGYIMQSIYEGNPLMNIDMLDRHLIAGFAGEAGSAQNPLGIKINTNYQSPVLNLFMSGYSESYNSLFDNTIKFEHKMDYIIQGLKIYGTVNYQDNYYRVIARKTPSLQTYKVQRSFEDPNVLEFFGGQHWQDEFESRGTNNWNNFYFDAGASWARSFGNHNLGALFFGKASKYYLPGDSNNTNTPGALVGILGRVTYDYDSRYMAEFNTGYNGTEQFIEGKRFGFFPAFSAGWVPTREKFFPKSRYVTFLKFRGSYGIVGNDYLGNRRYLYLPSTYLTNQAGYYWGNTGATQSDYYTGVIEGNIGNENVTWEKAEKYNAGVELKLVSDKLSLTYDWFKEDRKDILTTLATIPDIFGVAASRVPPANVGKTTNKGYEIAGSWDDRIGQVGYSIRGHLSFSRNKIIYKAEPSNPYSWMNETGHSIGQRFGYRSDGLYHTLEELANRPYLTATSNKATLGDIRYVDLTGDGVIDNKDIGPIGYPNFPEYHYGFNLGFNYKGLAVNVLFNGTANGSYYLDWKAAMTYYKGTGNAWQWQSDGRWTEEKVASGAKISYPRPTYSASQTDNNYLVSDFWMFSNNFFKLKNFEISYTFPATVGFMKAARISSLRIFFNGNNIYTFKNDMKHMGIDPETADGSSYIFPLTRIFNLGTSIQF